VAGWDLEQPAARAKGKKANANDANEMNGRFTTREQQALQLTWRTSVSAGPSLVWLDFGLRAFVSVGCGDNKAAPNIMAGLGAAIQSGNLL
jgi:hypothetical protein